MDGLAALIRSRFSQNPLSGDFFVFVSRRADRVRILFFDRGGYVLICKRLEQGTFPIPWTDASEPQVAIEAAELLLALEGIDLRGARRRKRWVPRLSSGEDRTKPPRFDSTR